MLPQVNDLCMIYQLNTAATRTGITGTDKNVPIHQIYTSQLFTNKRCFQVTGAISGINRTHKNTRYLRKNFKNLVLHWRHHFRPTCMVNGCVYIISTEKKNLPSLHPCNTNTYIADHDIKPNLES